MYKVSKEQNFDFMCFYSQKNNMADMVKFGYGWKIGFIAQIWLISAEGILWENVDNHLG